MRDAPFDTDAVGSLHALTERIRVSSIGTGAGQLRAVLTGVLN